MWTITADDNKAYIKQETLQNYIVKWEMKQKVFMKKTENFIKMLKSLVIHLKENVFHLIMSC